MTPLCVDHENGVMYECCSVTTVCVKYVVMYKNFSVTTVCVKYMW